MWEGCWVLLLPSITRIVVRTPLTMPMWLGCRSHTGLRMNAAIFGHMPEATRKVVHMSVTVHVQPTQEQAHRHLWGSTFTVNPPLATDLPHLEDGTPTTPSGTDRTATLEAVAATMLLLHGSVQYTHIWMYSHWHMGCMTLHCIHSDMYCDCNW